MINTVLNHSITLEQVEEFKAITMAFYRGLDKEADIIELHKTVLNFRHNIGSQIQLLALVCYFLDDMDAEIRARADEAMPTMRANV